MTAMTDKTRIRVAAGVTTMFLASISAAGLAVHASSAPPSAAAGSQATAAPAAGQSGLASGVAAAIDRVTGLGDDEEDHD